MTLYFIWMGLLPQQSPPPNSLTTHPPSILNMFSSSTCFHFIFIPLAMFRNLFNSVSISLWLSPSPRHVLHWALCRHPKYNYSLQLNGGKGSLGITRNRKWSGGLDRGGNCKSLIQLAEPWQQAPGGSCCGISGIKQCGFNRKRGFHTHTQALTHPYTHTHTHINTNSFHFFFPCIKLLTSFCPLLSVVFQAAHFLCCWTSIHHDSGSKTISKSLSYTMLF